MSHTVNAPQSAIVPAASPFALYASFNVKRNANTVLAHLKQLPQKVAELNQQQPDADVTLSIAFGHAFWQSSNQPMPDELIPFTPLGKGDTVAPATPTDILIHLHSNRHDLHFYLLNLFVDAAGGDVEALDETHGYRYLDSRDMTDFIDGTENPEGDERAEVAIIANGTFAGGSYVMTQRYVHELGDWKRLSVQAQEKIIGRTKPDSIELEDMPPCSHVGRVDLKEDGVGLKLVRHSLPYGKASAEHGLFFISYCNRLHNIKVQLESMFGETDGKTDLILRFTHAVSGAYFFAPSQSMLQALEIRAS